MSSETWVHILVILHLPPGPPDILSLTFFIPLCIPGADRREPSSARAARWLLALVTPSVPGPSTPLRGSLSPAGSLTPATDLQKSPPLRSPWLHFVCASFLARAPLPSYVTLSKVTHQSEPPNPWKGNHSTSLIIGGCEDLAGQCVRRV